MLLYSSLTLSGSCEYETVMTLGAELVGVAAGADVAAGPEVAAGADVAVAAGAHAARTILTDITNAINTYIFLFTVSPPTENRIGGLDTTVGENQLSSRVWPTLTSFPKWRT